MDRPMTSMWGQKHRYGEFEIVRCRDGTAVFLGQGAIGKTFEAVRTHEVAGAAIEERVALTVVNPALLESETDRLRFVRQLQSLLRVRHPNLTQYLACGEDGGEVYFVTDFNRGSDLARLVQRFGALPERSVVLIGAQVAAGLAELHKRHQLLHQDIKPSSIMLADRLDESVGAHGLASWFESGGGGVCRISSFGFVEPMSDDPDQRDRGTALRFVGSPMFASPEQVCERRLDSRSDIYSLGLVLWFLLQGRGPFLDARGESLREPTEALRRHLDVSSEHSSEFPPNVSEGFRRILGRMVAKRPEDRFASADDARDAMLKHLAEISAPLVTQSCGSLDDLFIIEERFGLKQGRLCFSAVARGSGERLRLVVAAEKEERVGGADFDTIEAHLGSIAAICTQPDLPASILRVHGVVRASETIVYAEEMPTGVRFHDWLMARAKNRRAVTFLEALPVLRQVAEGLDFLFEHGSSKVVLHTEDLWLDRSDHPADLGQDENLLITPLDQGRVVLFSGMWTPVPWSSSLNESADDSGSLFDEPDPPKHPVVAFCRLLYRVVGGCELANAAEFIQGAYSPTPALNWRSNNLIRDLVCQVVEPSSVSAVLAEIFVNENPPVRVVDSRHPPEELIRIPASEWRSNSTISNSSTQPGSGPSHSVPSLVGEVISPGIVRSPFAFAGHSMSVRWGDWRPGQEIVCDTTGKVFVLPKNLPPPVGLVSESQPGTVVSPYASDSGFISEVLPNDWLPGAIVLCPITSLPFALPQHLPLLVALADMDHPGLVGSPFAPGIEIAVPPDSWRAGLTMMCPVTGRVFALPPVVEHWGAAG